MFFGLKRSLVGVILGLFLCAGAASPASGGNLAGTLIGFVSDQGGVPQMGAAVFLYNHYDRLVGRALTNDRGAFGFESLLPGVYSIKVSLASFVPAVKEDVEVNAGSSSFLSINLASVLSSIELISSAPAQGKLMSDDWKWVLRTATSSRPVLRIRPNIDISDPSGNNPVPVESTALFSRTRGLVKFSTGEEGSLAAAGAQADLGTSFALATSVFGNNELQFSGAFGYASNTGTPTAGFRTSYSNDLWGAKPEVALTMRHVFMQGAAANAILSGYGNAPALRTMSVSTLERRQISERLHLEYGGSFESVAFLDRLNYFSPFARVTTDLGSFGAIELAYSSGMPPAELLAASSFGPGLEMENDLTVLALFPRVSLVGGAARVQRSQIFEAGYRRKLGKSRSLSVGVYREGVTNSAVMMAAPGGFYSSGDLLPDLSSNSSVFNIGNFNRLGFRVSATQQFGENLAVTLGAGNGGVLERLSGAVVSNDPNELRGAMRKSQRSWLAAKISGMVPTAGTEFSAGYYWTDLSVLSPIHLYLTTGMQPEMGLNVRIRQSLPSFGVWSGRLVASAELRNLLAQGYVPVATADGRKLYLIHNPQTVRGGFSFIF